MEHMRKLALGGAVAALIASAPANAAVTVTIEQVGANVVATTTGSLITVGLTSVGASPPILGMIPSSSYIYTGNAAANVIFYSGFSGISGFGPGGFTPRTAGAGLIFAIDGDPTGSYVGLATNFISGGIVDGTSIWANTTLAGLGLVAGTGTIRSIFDSVTVIINAPPGVPEPATWAMMLAGFGAVGFALRRRPVQARVRYA